MYRAREKGRLYDENKNVRVPVKYNIICILLTPAAARCRHNCVIGRVQLSKIFFFNKSLSEISFDFQ